MSENNSAELLGSIVDAAAQDKATEISSAFDDLMNGRLETHINQLKVDMAKAQFAGPFEVEETPATEEAEEEEAEDAPESDEAGDIELDMSDDEINDLLSQINSQEEPEDEEAT